MRKLLIGLLMCAGLALAGPEPEGKYVIVLQAGNETNEGGARAMHALLYAGELLSSGYDVVLVFDGAGTGWANELSKSEHPLNELYSELKKKGIMEEVCDHCAEHLKVKEKLSDEQKALLIGEYKGHPSLVRWIRQGYHILVL
jgi:predicted peroxiredoxin